MRALAAQGLAGELNALAVVDETVEDGIGVSGISDHLVPFIDRQLAGYDGGAAAVALFENLKQIVTRLGGERLKSPIVQDEQLDAGQGAEEPTIAAIAAGQLKIAEELRYSLIENGAVIAAGLVAQGRGEPAFADARWTSDDQIVVRFDPAPSASPGCH